MGTSMRALRRRIRAAAALTTVTALVAGSVLALSAPASAAGTPLLQDDFTGNAVSSTEYALGGSFTPCLTVAGGAGTRPTSCAEGAVNPVGGGALRLTSNGNELSGYLLYDRPLPTRAGLDISFNQYQWGGNGADGISFFLSDGRYALDQPGPAGGSLGYTSNGRQRGLAHALLGVGIDAFGNFGFEYNDSNCAVRGTRLRPDTLAVRGPSGEPTNPAGSFSGYCLLAQPVAIPGGADTPNVTQRPQGKVVRIIVDPPSRPAPQVTVFIDGQQLFQQPQPPIFASTPTFKFGWAASTGGQNNNHEVNYLSVDSVDPIGPSLQVSTPTSLPVVDADVDALLPVTVSTSAADGPEALPITATVTVPSGAAISGPGSGVGWQCPTPTGAVTSLSCIYTPSSPLTPGTQLPRLDVPVRSATSGAFTATATASSDDQVRAAVPASSTVTVRPATVKLAGAGLADATAPEAVVITPTPPTGGGTPVYALGTEPLAAEGTASIDASTGRITFLPAAGASGRSDFSYTVTSNGQTSQPAPVSIDIAPVGAPSTATTTSGRSVDVDLATLAVGSGIVGFDVDTDPARGSVSVAADGVATFQPAQGYSGRASFTYTVQDADGLTSAPATVDVAVDPELSDVQAEATLDEDGAATVSAPAPAVSGVGPFTYELLEVTGAGNAVIDPETGVVTYTAQAGTSEVSKVTYRVTDGAALSSPIRTATFTVRPYLGATGGTTTTGVELVLPAPPVQGTGPFRWSITTTPIGGVATIDESTGVVTYVPGVGFSGLDAVGIRAVDANGVTAAEVTSAIAVSPTVGALAGQTIADAAPSAVRLPATGTGRDLVYTLTGSLDPAVGTAAVEGTDIVVTPAAGFSGVIELTYLATDGDALASAPAAVTITVLPRATPLDTAAPSGDTSVVALPAPAGTGPFRWTLQPLPQGLEGSTVDPDTGELTLVAAPDFSGPAEIVFTVTDASGLSSAPVIATVDVRPVLGVPAPATTTATLAGGAPAPATITVPARGSGPFTFALTAEPAPEQGTAVVDPATGAITFTPAEGYSGTVDLSITATDANGTATTGSAQVVVLPVATDVPEGSRSGPFGQPQSFAPRPPSGTGPFTYRLTSLPRPDQGTASIDPVTGVITFVPAPGFSGVAGVSFVVDDANGLTSAPASVLFEVLAAEAAPPAAPGGGSGLPDAGAGPSSDGRLADTGRGAGALPVLAVLALLLGVVLLRAGGRAPSAAQR